VILSGEYVWAHKILTRIRTRFPNLATRMHEATEKARAFMHRTPAD
jgi:hypothetical protein